MMRKKALKCEEKIGVIIPVYNMKDYLNKCMESVTRQTYCAIEIILIDDGSNDGSEDLCEVWAKRDKRIRVIHQENSGLSAARNKGIRCATSQYITFIDSDDYVSNTYVENLWKTLCCGDAELAITCGKKFHDEKECFMETFDRTKTRIYSSESALQDLLYRRNIPIYAWAKLYHRSLLQDILFPEGELFEDLSTEYLIFHNAKTISFNPIRDYYYRQRKGSIVNSQFNKMNMIQIESTETIIQFIEQNYPQITNSAKSKCFITTLNLYRTIPYGKQYKTERILAKETIKKYRESVLKDKEEKLFIRGMAGVAFVNVECLSILGKIYQYLMNCGIVKLRKPI